MDDSSRVFPSLGPKNNRLFILLIGVVVTASALLGCFPCIGWMDAGDFVTASSSLGVPHATGFPVFTLVGHLACYLPFGTIAMRVAVLSALFMGAAVTFLLMVIQYNARNIFELLVPGVVFVLVSIGAPTLYLHSRVPEVYALNCALAAGCLLCIQKVWHTRDARWCFGLALFLGLGLANHATFRLWAPLFVLAVVLNRRWRQNVKVYGVCAIVAAATLLSYLYLPAAALRNGPHNWGNPSSLGRFWDHVNASEIQMAFRDEMGFDVFSWQIHAERLVGQLWASLGPLLLCGIVAMLAGTYLCIRQSIRKPGPEPEVGPGCPGSDSETVTGRKSTGNLPELGLLVFGLVCLDFLYATIINPMGINDWQNGQLGILLLAGAGGFFIVRILTLLSQFFTRFKVRLSALGLVIPLSLLPYLDHDFYPIGNDWSIEDMAVIHTSFAEPGAMTVLVSDSMIASHLYVSTVLDARPDMAIFGRNQLSNGRRFAYMARHQPYALVDEKLLDSWERLPAGLSDEQFVKRAENLVAANISLRRIYWEVTSKSSDLPNDYPVVHRWPLGWVVNRLPGNTELCIQVSRSYCADAFDVAFAGRARNISGVENTYYRRWMAEQWSWAGRQLYLKGAYPAAMNMFLKSVQLASNRAPYYTNIAVCLAAIGRPADALDVVLYAIELDPLSKTAVKNAIMYAVTIGDDQALTRLNEHARQLGMEVQQPD